MGSVRRHPPPVMGPTDFPSSPRKKQRLDMTSSDSPMDNIPSDASRAISPMDADDSYDRSQYISEQQAKEAACGIIEFVSPNLLGFTGILKKRYTDFLVNEILPSGEVVHLDSLKEPKRETHQDLYDGPGTSNISEPKMGLPEQKFPPATHEATIRQFERNIKLGDQKEAQTEQISSIKEGAPVEKRGIDASCLNREGPVALPVHDGQSEWVPQKVDETVQEDEKRATITTLPVPDASLHHAKKISPHKRIPPPSPSIPLSMPDRDKSILTPENPTRKKETVRIRQTAEGWVEVDEQKERGLQCKKAAEDTGARIKPEESRPMEDIKKVLEPEEARYEPKPSTQAQWQAFAGTESAVSTPVGFLLRAEDKDTLLVYFGPDIVDAIVALYDRIVNSPHRKSKDYGTVKSQVIDRETRSKIHQDIRRIFDSRLESTTDNDGAMIIAAMAEKPVFHARTPINNDRNTGRNKKERQWTRPSWEELGGNFLHFSLFKENKDTMEAISWLTKELKMKPSAFQFAGTKDRRAVTVQRVSAYRVLVDRMIAAGRNLRQAKIGNFEYRPHALQLGELTGNEFVVTLRDCDFHFPVPIDSKAMVEGARSIVGSAVRSLGEKGFLNYYGLQRFGTFATSTDIVGMKMLQGNFRAAVDAILDFSPAALAAAQDPTSAASKIAREDQARAITLNAFKTKGNADLHVLPRKFSAESNIIRHLSKRGQSNDYHGALQNISRNMRLMYVHAYQSLVWNMVASERWKRFGSTVIEGDLVLIDEHKSMTEPAIRSENVDEDGEAIFRPSDEDRAADPEDMFTRARALSKEEAENGKFTIFDVVLPTPGYDILYPANEMGQFYVEFMLSERGGGLDPYDMRRKWKDISLSGSYRKLLARPGKDISFDVKVYKDENEQFVETDLDRLYKGKHEHDNTVHDKPLGVATTPMDIDEKADRSHIKSESDMGPGGVSLSGDPYRDYKIAVILKYRLGSSQYATMALRELMKLGGLKTYKPDFGGGR